MKAWLNRLITIITDMASQRFTSIRLCSRSLCMLPCNQALNWGTHSQATCSQALNQAGNQRTCSNPNQH